MSGPVVVDVSDLSPGQVRAVRAAGPDGSDRSVLVCNAGGDFYAIENRCPHAAVPLEHGALRGTELECPLHGGSLDVRDGSPRRRPIRRPAASFPVRHTDDGRLEIDLGA